MLLKLNRKQISIKIRFLKVYFSLRIELLTFWTLLTFTKVLIIPLPKQLTEKVKFLSQRHQSHCEPIYFLECNNVVDGGSLQPSGFVYAYHSAVPGSNPKFTIYTSSIYSQIFNHICQSVVKRTKINRKRPSLAHL